MNRPSFQFYPADWRNNANLRRCSDAARGAWMEVLCVLHDSDEYGVCRWPLVELARAAGVPVKLLKELSEKKVLKGADANAEAYTYTPRHAGQDGETHILIPASPGPCWYSSRLVRDDWVRLRRGGNTRFDSDNQPPKPSPNRRVGERVGITKGGPVGDGPSSSSSSSSILNTPLSPKGGMKGPLQLRAEKLMRRRVETPLTAAETRAFRKNRPAIEATSESDWLALEAYYQAPQEKTFSRKDLAALLNNWNGEIDRARAWFAPRRRADEIVDRAQLAEPVGWREWVAREMPDCPYAPTGAKHGCAWAVVEPLHQRAITDGMKTQ